jgi:hypothetical protein
MSYNKIACAGDYYREFAIVAARAIKLSERSVELITIIPPNSNPKQNIKIIIISKKEARLARNLITANIPTAMASNLARPILSAMSHRGILQGPLPAKYKAIMKAPAWFS